MGEKTASFHRAIGPWNITFIVRGTKCSTAVYSMITTWFFVSYWDDCFERDCSIKRFTFLTQRYA